MLVREARGATVATADGRTFIDTMAGLWCVNVGYGRSDIAQAVYAQLQTLPYYPHTAANEPAARLAELLTGLTGGDLGRVYYTNSGSEANEAAFKIARQYGRQVAPGANRYKFVARQHAYHGTTMGALAASGQSERKWKFEPLVPGFVHTVAPYCYRCALGRTYPACDLACARLVETTILHEGPETVAGVIVEPIVGGGGVIVPPDGYLPELREITRRYGVLLIVDEVICGFGRTGSMFGYQTFGVEPDMVSLAKGISSAYLPLGALVTTEAVFSAFLGDPQERVQLAQVNTFGGHPAACAAGIANLRIIIDEGLVERARDFGGRLLEELKGLEDYPHVGEVRGRGMIYGIELVEDRSSKAPLGPAKLAEIVNAALERGVILGKMALTTYHQNNVIQMAPPLVLSEDEAQTVVRVLHEVIGRL
jgi:adenosylmethionine-8-amino-7-oxononanoate aminotransferase